MNSYDKKLPEDYRDYNHLKHNNFDPFKETDQKKIEHMKEIHRKENREKTRKTGIPHVPSWAINPTQDYSEQFLEEYEEAKKTYQEGLKKEQNSKKHGIF